MNYTDCPIICELEESTEPLISTVPTDEFTDMVQNNFDYTFTGESKFYPILFPKELEDMSFDIMAIVGASGSGKSTMLKTLGSKYHQGVKQFDNTKAIVSNFDTPQDASNKLCAVGLNSMPTWCRPRNVLSVGEGFRADISLNLASYTVFDEFTSTVDRNVAKSTCKGLYQYVKENGLTNIIVSSCHKDFIPYLQPSFVLDLDTKKVYDCRGICLGKPLPYTSTSHPKKECGVYLGNITI